jgi:two-component system, chemotaxis family, CheB/CheR fusion protein
MGDNLERNSQPQVGPEPPKRAASFPVIGLGASAGGLQALKEFFTHMPAESGMAFVVIMHLSPKHESHAAALLQATTNMPVTQVTQAIKVEPNHVYVIPPTKNLEMNDGHINLAEPEPLHKGKQVAIDLFFRTLGDTHKQMAVGIVLSGMGSDGTNGLKRIKEQNGLAFAQDPKDAEHDSMPRHAIGSGLVDFVLPVALMPEKLIEIWRNAGRIKLPSLLEPPAVVSQEDADEAALRDIFMLLRTHTGHDFTHYKRATVLRRIERRLQVNGLLELTAYRDFMREHPMEAQALLKDLLISVTNFFRDRPTFNEFERQVVPILFHEKTAEDQVRVWVAGCATGEEAYSVAMLLMEYAERLASPPAIQIFATDIDEAAIATAREGSYTETIEADVSMERLRRFFTKEPGGYRIKKDVRERVLFAAHNLIKDPPFSRLDAVTCRNLLIYLNREAQGHIFELFNFVLLPNGFLLLGNSESAEGAANLFATVDKKHRIFRAESIARTRLRVPSLPLSIQLPHGSAPQTEATRERQKISFGELHQKLLEQYAPPSVIIDANYDIVHLSDRAGRFLQFVGGEPSHNLLKVVHPELRLELRTALFQAAQSGKSFEARRIRIERDGRDFYVNMIARPVRDGGVGTAHNYFLVLFDEVEGLTGAESSTQQSAGETEPVMLLLEEELQRSKEQHQTTIEQYETQTEELKASNEELQAMNEELRSATEELETGKEELQSVNEEIQTINGELKQKIDELAIANSDLENLITSTDLATVFVDRDLSIKFFTPRAQDIFNLIPSDTGRSISDITHKLDYADLLQDVERVLDGLHKIDREVMGRDGRWYIVQVTAYRTAANSIGGVILTFIDFTARKLAESSLLEAKERLGLLVESAKDHAIYTMDADGRIDYRNSGAQALFGYTESEIIGQSALLLFTPEDRERQELEREMREASEGGSAEDERWHVRKDGSRFYTSGILSLLRDERVKAGNVHGYAMIARDLTRRKAAEESIEESIRFQAHLLDTVEQSVIATDLDGIVIYWNQFAQTLYGWTAEEATGRHIMELTTSETMSEQALEILFHLRQGESWTGEFNVQRRDGTTFPAQIINSPITDDKRTLIGIVGVSTDITERKRQEASLIELTSQIERQARVFNTTLSSITDFAYIFDREGRFVYANQALLDLWGLKLDEAMGRNFFDLQYPDELASRLQQQIQQVFDTRQVLKDETPYTSPTGAGGYYEYIFSPVIASDGTVEVVAGSTRDISERIRVETALRESRERLQMAMNAAKIYSWEMSLATQQIEWSNNLERVIGFQLPSNFAAVTGFIHPEDREETAQLISQAISGGEDYESEFRLVNPNSGEIVWMRGQGVLVDNAQNSPKRFVGITQNITERKRAEEELNASEERLRTIFEASRDGILVEDDEHIVYVNQSYTRLLGYEAPEELIGKHVSSVISSEDTERLLGFGKSRVRGNLPSSVYEFKGKRKDGTLIEVEASVSASSVTGHSYITSIVRDITERKRAEERLRVSEQRFRATFEQANVGIVQLSHDGKLLMVNPGFCKIVGYTETECQRLTVKDVTHPDDYELEEAETRRLLSGEISGYSIEKRYLHKNGAIVWGQMTASLVRRASDEPFYTLAIIEDITERKRAEAELKQINEQLEGRVAQRTAALSEMNDVLQEEVRERRRIEAERVELLRRIVFAQEDERRRIAREMHDQFGQQLTVLKLKLDAVKEGCGEDENLCGQLEALQKVAAQLDEDVDHMVWEMRPTALDDLGLESALSSYIQNWSKHIGIPVQLHTSGMDKDRLTPEIETALYRIAQEALNNVAKHAKAEIVAVVLERRADHVSLIIEDDGVGFDLQEVLEADDKGLGLIGMRERAALIGGTFEIESQPNVGATVFVRIPTPPVAETGETNE